MRFEEKKMICKDGRTCILRNAEPSDAEVLIRYLKQTAGETPYLMREPEEITITLERQENFLRGKLENPRELMLIGTIDGEHVGNCSLMSMGDYRRYAHRCTIAIALYQKYCGLGIGKAMLKEILRVAKELGYEQAELEVISGNESAIRLYESLGFEIYGTLPNSVKYKDGTYAADYFMVKRL